MAFDTLSDRLQNAFKSLRGKGKLNEKDIKDAMREVRLALLEADVNFKVVKSFVKKISDKAVGKDVLESLTPGQQVVKIVNEELTSLMGEKEEKLVFDPKLSSFMLVGLQGAGKTTMSGKLALHLKKQNKNPLLVACDVYRPAAIKQLQVVGKQIDVPVFTMGDKVSPVDIAKASIEFAKKEGHDVVLIDTAGRLHIDENLMEELKSIKEEINPSETLLVVDSMTGQDAVNVADSFNDILDISGVILTKLDGDTRGGAALSIKEVTGKPIKFSGIGEKMEDIEVFHPERMASRILGMGDVLTLIEKAQDSIDEKEAKELGSKLMTKEFNFEDYLKAIDQMQKLGPLGKVMEMIPGMNSKDLGALDVDKGEKEMKKSQSIVYSMTVKERRNPKLLSNSKRKKRVARGSGTTIQEVNKLIKGFDQMKKMMKQMESMQKGSKKGMFGKLPF